VVTIINNHCKNSFTPAAIAVARRPWRAPSGSLASTRINARAIGPVAPGVQGRELDKPTALEWSDDLLQSAHGQAFPEHAIMNWDRFVPSEVAFSVLDLEARLAFRSASSISFDVELKSRTIPTRSTAERGRRGFFEGDEDVSQDGDGIEGSSPWIDPPQSSYGSGAGVRGANGSLARLGFVCFEPWAIR
jgi:hypothetical protein